MPAAIREYTRTREVVLLDDKTRFRYEQELASEIKSEFASFRGDYAGLERGIAAKAEAVLKRIQDEEAASFLYLLLLAQDLDEDEYDTHSPALEAAVSRSTYPSTRAAQLAKQIADNTRERLAGGADRASVFSQERAERIGVTETTGAISAGSHVARSVFSSGTIVMIWATERDGMVCDICRPLHGRPEREWKDKFPIGPAAHVGCRCRLVAGTSRDVLEDTTPHEVAELVTVREKFREEDHPRDDRGRWVSKQAIADAIKDPTKVKKLLARVTQPSERRKLEKALGIKTRKKPPPPEKPDTALSRRAKKAYVPSTAEVQHLAKAISDRVAARLGMHATTGNLPMDHEHSTRRVSTEFKTLQRGEQHRVQMRRDSRLRKEAETRKYPNRRFYTVAADVRDTAHGGQYKQNYSGKRYYAREGVGAFRLNQMQSFRTIKQLKEFLQL